MLPFIRSLENFSNIQIAFIRNDAFGIVVKRPLSRYDVALDVRHHVRWDLQLLERLFIALKDLDGVPSLLLLGHAVYCRLLDMRDGVLDLTRKNMLRCRFAVPSRLDRGFSRLHNADLLKRRDLKHGTAKLFGKRINRDRVTALADDIDHIDRHDNGNTQLGQLCGQIQIALEVRAVYHVQNGIGTLAHKIISRDDLLKCIGGERINTGQVYDRDPLVLLQLSLFLFYGYTRPVTYELIGAGERVKQCGFTTVWISCQCNFQIHVHPFLSLKPYRLTVLKNTGFPAKSFYLDHFGIGFPQGKLISAYGQLKRIAKRSNLTNADLHALGNAHIHNTATKCALAVNLDDLCAATDLYISQRFHSLFLFSLHASR